MIDYFKTSSDKLITALIEHIELTSFSLLFALLFASVITVILLFYPKVRQASVYVLSLLYAIPSFALFTLLIPVTGLGTRTAIIALVIYAQYTLVRTFLAGLTQVDDSIVEAATGMGMTRWQILSKIQLPLAQSSIFCRITFGSKFNDCYRNNLPSTINAGGLGSIFVLTDSAQ